MVLKNNQLKKATFDWLKQETKWMGNWGEINSYTEWNKYSDPESVLTHFWAGSMGRMHWSFATSL